MRNYGFGLRGPCNRNADRMNRNARGNGAGVADSHK
jgi:hypothetical protein